MATTTWDREHGKDRDRGRGARTPTQIPAKGWKDTLMRIKEEVKKDNLSLVAAGMSYFALLALVPALTSFVLIYAWVNDPSAIGEHLSKASAVLPGEVQKILTTQLTTLSATTSSSLGWGAIITLLVSLFSASKGSKCLIDALNIIYEEDDRRGFLKYNALALGFTFLGVLMGILAIGVIVGIPTINAFLNLNETLTRIMTIVSWVILLGLFSFYLSFAYRFGPSRKQAKWKWVSVGAVLAAVLWAIGSFLFSWYATNFGDFNKTYGSLGAIILMMTWFYISSFVILLGAEVNAEMEHQTKVDTTKGKEKPIGTRDAHMADTVGKSYQ